MSQERHSKERLKAFCYGDSSDEFGDLVRHSCFFPWSGDRDVVGSSEQGKREIGLKRGVERLEMKEWGKGRKKADKGL